MLDKPDDAVMTLKRNPKYNNRSLDAMVAIAESAKSRSFASFKKVGIAMGCMGVDTLFMACLLCFRRSRTIPSSWCRIPS